MRDKLVVWYDHCTETGLCFHNVTHVVLRETMLELSASISLWLWRSCSQTCIGVIGQYATHVIAPLSNIILPHYQSYLKIYA